MYTIQYYKNLRKKIIKTNNDEKYSCCKNIKSITIDMSDINHVLLDEKQIYLVSLYARLHRRKDINDLKYVTINNTDFINTRRIYDILNTKWMINKNEINNISEEQIEKTYIELENLKKRYQKEVQKDTHHPQKIEILLKNKIKLMEYYLNTITQNKKCSYNLVIKK